MKRLRWILFYLSLTISTFAQNYTISVTVKGLPSYPLLLTDFYGDKNSIIDTVKTNTLGKAVFTLPANQRVGMYKIVFNDDQYLDFVFNHENIEFVTSVHDVQASLKVVKSEENQLYFSTLLYYKEVKEKLNMLLQLKDLYIADDVFSKQISDEYHSKLNALNERINTAIKNNPKSYAAKLLKVKAEQFPDCDANAFTRTNSVRSRWFDNVDFSDTSLFYSNAFTTKIIGYLQQFTSKYYSQEQQMQMFKYGIDTIMMKAKVSTKAYNFVVDFMINGFEEMGNGNLVEYIASRYSDDNSCEHDGSKTTLERKILSYTKLKVGSAAPAFQAITDNGQKISLDGFANKTVMLVFWATWCSHCQQALPEIVKMYNARIDKTFELITVSLDTNKTEWKQYLTLHALNKTLNVCEGKSWDGKIATDYQIYSTPTIFVIKNKKIVARPGDLDGLKDALKQQHVIQ